MLEIINPFEAKKNEMTITHSLVNKINQRISDEFRQSPGNLFG